MNFELICIDMDGTLLNKKHKISRVSKEALKKAYDMGIQIVISTGRMYTDARFYTNLLDVKSPVIASNGAIIKDIDNRIIHKSTIKEDLPEKLLKLFTGFNAKPTYYTPEKAYTGNLFFYLVIQYFKITGMTERKLKIEYVGTWKKWSHILNIEKNNIIKCEIISEDKRKLAKVYDKLIKINEIEIASSAKHNIEITGKGVSKGKAAEILASCYNIEREKIIAIGDSENDLSMIEFAGMGVAMGNAIDIVKKKADYITDTNDNDGAAKAVNYFINR